MNWVDIIIIGISIFFIARGIYRGFFREIGSLAGVILGICLSVKYQPQMTNFLKKYVPAGIFLPLVSAVLIFLIVLVLCNCIGWGLMMMMKKTLFGWADKTLGAGLAILKVILIIYLSFVLITFFIPSQTPLIAESKIAPMIIKSYQSIVSVVSPDLYQKWKKRFQGISEDKKKVTSTKTVTSTYKNGSA